ncbi:hypothetical protein BJF79_01215 [Actinomadura sp. CNU-125]|nr:hypothetical protein [Actinomadura sp. CNU-125]OLT27268.1 hypothetical protein BJF79_01215 [Actinomadura sp. CNU-125]
MTSGNGAHCATSAAASGPAPNPAETASAVARTPGPGASSLTHAVPAARTAPVTTPASSRPAYSSSGTAEPAIRTSVTGADAHADGSATRRRPNRSDAGPPSARPGTSPSAYTPNMACAAPPPRCSRSV